MILHNSVQEVQLDVLPVALCERLGGAMSVVVDREMCAGKKVLLGVNRDELYKNRSSRKTDSQ